MLLEYVVLGSMRPGVVFVLAGSANHLKCYHWIQHAAIAVCGQGTEETSVVGEVSAVHQKKSKSTVE